MIRCSNCGWSNNPDNSIKCEKCNAPLDNSTVENATVSNESQESNLKKTVMEASPMTDNNDSKSTCHSCGYPLRAGAQVCPQCGNKIGGTQHAEPPISAQPIAKVCAKCGKENPQEATFCSSCGENLNVKSSPSVQCPKCGKENEKDAAFCLNCGTKLKKNDFNKTILPSRLGRCSLKLIPDDGENMEPVTLSFSDAEVILNRDNTEPENKTITRDEQAVLTYENKKWYIQNKSEMNSTYILAKDKTELQEGDIILLGDRKFEFGL